MRYTQKTGDGSPELNCLLEHRGKQDVRKRARSLEALIVHDTVLGPESGRHEALPDRPRWCLAVSTEHEACHPFPSRVRLDDATLGGPAAAEADPETTIEFAERRDKSKTRMTNCATPCESVP